jgi:hypothetical protein
LVEILMVGRRVALSTVLAVAASMSTIGPSAGEDVRGVVELFTSQGCSSCPPADQLLGELAGDPSIVALSLPIDYWDYLGWKDTLAKPRHTARQRGYAHMRGDREVYTPQVVVNGSVHVMGSDRNAIERAIATTSHAGATLSVPVKLALTGAELAVTVMPAAGESPGGEVWLCALTKSLPIEIGRGENHGRVIAYHNVVRRWVKLGDWTGAARSFTVPAAEFELDGVDAVAVIIQGGTPETPKTMLGAALESIR